MDLNIILSELRKLRCDLLDRADEIVDELDDVDAKIDMAEAVHSWYCKHAGVAVQSLRSVDSRLQRKFAGMTIKQMLVLVAQEKGGYLEVSDARSILVKAGVFKNERNAATSISPILRRHQDLFFRIGKGLYVLTANIEKASPTCAIDSYELEDDAHYSVPRF